MNLFYQTVVNYLIVECTRLRLNGRYTEFDFTVAIQFNCLFDNIPSIKENGKQCIRWHLKDNIVAIIRFLVQNVAKEVVFNTFSL